MIYRYSEHYIDEDDISKVIEVLKSDCLTSGPKVEKFENLIKSEFNYNHAIAVNSGTSALHLALKSLDLCQDDEVIVPSITFVATSNAVEYCGAKVVFADVDKETLLIDFQDVCKKITQNTKAIIAVDIAGQLCDYKELKKICNTRNLILISDACHSFGVNYFNEDEKPDFICFSFHPCKSITTGEGGMILTDNSFFYSVIKLLKCHGMTEHKRMIYLGYNYKMADINAALGISQFYKINKFLRQRKFIANLYNENLKKISIKHINDNHSNHLYIIKVNNRNKVFETLKNEGIQTQIHYIPVYDNPYYYLKYANNLGSSIAENMKCPNTEEIKNNILSIPIYYSLTEYDVNYISNKILEVIDKCK